MLVEFKKTNGAVELVNPAHVINVFEMRPEGTTRINYVNGSYLVVDMTIDDVWAVLEGDEL